MRYVPDFIFNLYNKSPNIFRSLFSSCYWLLKSYKERNKLYKKCLAELREAQWYDYNKTKEIQLARLVNIYKHAFNTVPYYNNVYKELGLTEDSIKSLEDLKKIPIITKEIIRENFNSLISSNPGKLQMIGETSGTTGKPLKVGIDKVTEAYHNAVIKLHEEIAQINKGWYGIMAGYKILPSRKKKPPYWITNYIDKQIHFSSYHLNKNTFEYYEKHLRKKNVRVLKGYPTAIGSLAGFILEAGRKLKLDAVFVSSQPLEKWSKNAIEEAFECKVYDFYSQVERVMWAISCEKSDELHIIEPINVVEFEKEDGNNEFSIITTNIVNYYMPLIRYKIDDVTHPIHSFNCACKRKWAKISPVQSRRGDYLVTPSGKKIPAPSFTIAFWGIPGIVESQVEQIDIKNLIVRIVPSSDFLTENSVKIKERINEITSYEMNVIIQFCEKIKEGKTGKRLFILRSPDVN